MFEEIILCQKVAPRAAQQNDIPIAKNLICSCGWQDVRDCVLSIEVGVYHISCDSWYRWFHNSIDKKTLKTRKPNKLRQK